MSGDKQAKILHTCGATLLLVILVFSVFGAGLDNGLVWDDIALIRAQGAIAHTGLLSVFTEAFLEGPLERAALAYYRPIIRLSLLFDAWWTEGDIWGYHLTNVLIHLASTLAFFAFLRTTGLSTKAALLTASLWAVSPIVTQPVYWISGRTDLLCGLFVFLSLLAYTRFVRSRSIASFSCALICMLCALGAKEMAIALPFAFTALEWHAATHPFQGRPSRITLSIVWMVLLGYGWFRFIGLDITVTTWTERPDSLFALLVVASRIFLWNLRHILIPWPTIIEYDPMEFLLDGSSLSQLGWLAGALTVVGLLIAPLVRTRKQSHAFLFCCSLLFFIPIANIVDVYPPLADRFLYIPSAFIIAGFAHCIVKRCPLRFTKPLAIACSAIVLLFAFGSHSQAPLYESDETLFTQVIKQTPKQPYGYVMLSRFHEQNCDLQEAIRAVEPTLSQGRNSSGPQRLVRLLERMDQPSRAESILRRLVLAFPKTSDIERVHLLGFLLRHRRYDEALHMLEDFPLSVRNSPAMEASHIACLAGLSRWSETIERAQSFIDNNPNHKRAPYVLRKLAAALARTRRLEDAIEVAYTSWQTSRGEQEDLILLAQLASLRGDLASLAQLYTEAIPERASTADEVHWLTLAAAVHARENNIALAIDCYRRAIDGPLVSADLHAGLCVLLLQQGKYSEAIEHARTARKLAPHAPEYDLAVDLIEKFIANATITSPDADKLAPQRANYVNAVARALSKRGR